MRSEEVADWWIDPLLGVTRRTRDAKGPERDRVAEAEPRLDTGSDGRPDLFLAIECLALWTGRHASRSIAMASLEAPTVIGAAELPQLLDPKDDLVEFVEGLPTP
jgi:hypothetical protein